MADRDRGFDANAWCNTRPAIPRDAADPIRIRRMRQRALLERITVVVFPLGSLALLIAAVSHAANHLEHALATAAAFGTLLIWLIYFTSRRQERRALAASVPEFMAAALRRRREDQRLAVSIFVTLGTGLVFWIPWWIGGIPFHLHALLSRVVILTLWLPASATLCLGLWSVILWRRAKQEIPGLRRAAAEFAGDE